MRNRVFRFGTVEICPTIEEYARLIGVPYVCESVFVPCFEPSFKQRLSKTLGIRKKLLETEGEFLKRCSLSFFCGLYRTGEQYDRPKAAFLIKRQLWANNRVKAFELSVLGHILFPKESTHIDLGLLELRDQIDQGLSFVPALIADTYRALDM